VSGEWAELSRAVTHALRHEPRLYELELDDEGWTPVDALAGALSVEPRWRDLSRAQLEAMIERADKQRHEIDGLRIRALYGHSVPGRIAKDVELALVVCFRFGFSDGHLQPLLTLTFADWHQRHEDMAMAPGKLRSPDSVNALVHLVQWVPAYLEFDDARALAVKAMWALGGIGSEAAHEALKSLASSECSVVAENAVAQLQK
jgi:hypothetical protein